MYTWGSLRYATRVAGYAITWWRCAGCQPAGDFPPWSRHASRSAPRSARSRGYSQPSMHRPRADPPSASGAAVTRSGTGGRTTPGRSGPCWAGYSRSQRSMRCNGWPGGSPPGARPCSMPGSAVAASWTGTGTCWPRTSSAYQELLTRAAELLSYGESVIADASWISADRRAAAAIAEGAAAEIVQLHCTAPPAAGPPLHAPGLISCVMRLQGPATESRITTTGQVA